MSTEQEDTENLPESLFKHFKRCKVAISGAIKTPFPFFELLRDNELITEEMYKAFTESCTNLIPVKKVAYKALDVLEERFAPEILLILFSEENRSAYPDLECIVSSFGNAIPNKLCSQESDKGDPNSQLSLEQGPADSCSQESLTWFPSDPSSSDGWRSNDRGNTTFIQENQTENHQFSSPQIQTVVSLSENGLSEDLYQTTQINQGGGDTIGDATDEQEKQATKLQGPDPEPKESCELEVQPNNGHKRLEPHSPLPWNEERAVLLSNGIQINPCSVHLVDIKKENSSFLLDGAQQTRARTNRNQDSEVIVLSSEDSDDGNNFSEESTLIINWSNKKTESQKLSPHSSCPTVSAGSSYPKSDGESHQATLPSSLHVPLDPKKTLTYRKIYKRRDASDTDSLSSRKKPRRTRLHHMLVIPAQRRWRQEDPRGSLTSQVFLHGTTNVENNSTSRKEAKIIRRKRARHRMNLIRNIKIPSRTKAFPRRRINSSSQRGRKRGRRIPRQINADFNHPELPVTCGDAKGILYKEKFKQGIYEKSIQCEDGQWCTLKDFEIKGNRGQSKNWRQSIRCYGWPLRELIEEGHLPNPPRKRKKMFSFAGDVMNKGFCTHTPHSIRLYTSTSLRRDLKLRLKNSKRCKVCCRGRKVYGCAICRKYYHKKCHIPPVEDKSGWWKCVFCKAKEQLRCQENQACYKESEVLKRKMLPEEQLKCELLLLTMYCNSKSDFFIPKPKQKKENFPGLQEHMWLNKVKNRLNKKAYHSVQRFVEDMRLIFQNHSVLYKDSKFKNLGSTVRSLFEKTFKRTFSIDDTSKQLPPRTHTVLLT